jgi:hypothetical protein
MPWTLGRLNGGVELSQMWTRIPKTSRQAHPLAVLVALVLSATALSLTFAACGKDPYSGTWKSTTTFQDADSGKLRRSVLTIEKSDDGWVVTDVLGRSFACRETDGGLAMVRGPSGVVTNGDFLKRVGRRLILLDSQGAELMQFVRE